MQLSLCCPPLPLATTKMLPKPLRPAITPCCRAACGEERDTGGTGTELLPSPGSPRHPLRVCAGRRGLPQSSLLPRHRTCCRALSWHLQPATRKHTQKFQQAALPRARGDSGGSRSPSRLCSTPPAESGSCYGPEQTLGSLSEPNKGRDGANIWAGELLI